MTYEHTITIVAVTAIVLSAVAGLYEKSDWTKSKPVSRRSSEYLRDMEHHLNSRIDPPRNPLLTTFGGRTKRRKK